VTYARSYSDNDHYGDDDDDDTAYNNGDNKYDENGVMTVEMVKMASYH
jgi:hypothetical protein